MNFDDEPTPVVFDCGSGMCRAGFGGDDTARVYVQLPSSPIKVFNPDYTHPEIDISTLRFPIERGMITNWDDMEQVWAYLFHDLRSSPEEHPVFMVERALCPKDKREKTMEILFETFNSPAYLSANSATLGVMASGRMSGVVLDSGAGLTQSVAVHDLAALPHTTVQWDFGGEDITRFMVDDYLQDKAFGQLRPYLSDTTKIWETFTKVKREVTAVSERYPTFPGWKYRLPDDKTVEFGQKLVDGPELLFQPSLRNMQTPGIHEMIAHSVKASEPELYRVLYQHIILCGGNTMFRNLSNRLQKEVQLISPPSFMATVIAAPERAKSIWIGASILSTLSLAKDAWITKAQYEEAGPSIIHRATPLT